MNLLFSGLGRVRQCQSLIPLKKSACLRNHAHAPSICKFLASSGLLLYCLAARPQTVTLGWNASTSSGVTGYRLYRGTTSGSYNSMTNVGNVTQATVLGLVPGVTNYFTVTAYNTNAESAYSAEIVYAAPATNARPPASLTFAADAGS